MAEEPTERCSDRMPAARLLLAGLVLLSVVGFAWWRFIRPHQADLARPPAQPGPCPTPAPPVTGAPRDDGAANLPPLTWSTTVSEKALAAPAVGDVDGDRLPEVAVCGEDGDLRVLSGRDGKVLRTFETRSEALTTPAIEDFDGDSSPELLFGTRDGRVFAIHGKNGEHFWTHNVHDQVFQVATVIRSTGADAVFAHERGVKSLRGATAEQTVLTEFPRKGRVQFALADLNGDGWTDWVVNYREAESHTRAVSGEDGSILWMRQTGESALSLPAFRDLDGNGTTDCLFAAEGEGLVLAVAGETGSEIRRWTAPQVGHWRPSLAWGVHGEFPLRVLVAAAGGPGWVAALSGDEDREVWRSAAGEESRFAPVVFDAYVDGTLECVVADGATGLAVRSALDGALVARFDLGSTPLVPPVAADVDGDERPEIVAVVEGRVMAFRLPRRGR